MNTIKRVENISDYICPKGHRKCADGLQCVYKNEHDMCNGRKECNDGSDEDPIVCRGRHCVFNALTFCSFSYLVILCLETLLLH